MQDGQCWEQTTLAPLIDVKDSGFWPMMCKTPSAADSYTGNLKKKEYRFGNSGSLAQEVQSGFLETHRKWPTPTASDTEGGISRDVEEKNGSFSRTNAKGVRWGVKLRDTVAHTDNGGKLNPFWVEWLMSWPIGWSDLQPLETGKFLAWLNSHGRF